MTEIHVRAEQPFYGMFKSGTLDASCRVAFEFVPETGRDYQVTFQWDAYKGPCTVKLAEVGRSAESASKDIGVGFWLEFGGRRYINPTWEPEMSASNRCIDPLTKTYWF